MSTTRPSNGPGLRNQAGVRTALRVAGVVTVCGALLMVVVGGVELVTLEGFEEPHRFWMLLVGIPLLGVGLMMLQAGFAGAGARYLSGEYSPVAKDTATYLTGGKGLLNLGVDDDARQPAQGPYCRSCGTRNDADARFCDSCGTSLA